MKKIATVIGARPQFIKAATVSRAIARQGQLTEILIHTGQHFDANMSEVFFDQLKIPHPRYNLEISGGTHGRMTGRQLESIEQVLIHEKPDMVLVYGDTNSTLAGALAAAKLHIPMAHVEAGLRSFNRKMPEELNRVLTDHMATFLFTPTSTANENLLREGIEEKSIHLVGDVMYDAALFYKEMDSRPPWFHQMGVAEGEYVLCTIHRAENTDDPERLQSIMKGLSDSGMPIILPLHPRTKKKIAEFGLSIPPNCRITPPVGYLEMVWLERHSRSIATDSGGVQKEAYFHEKPCVTMRDETEWTELVSMGVNQLVGTSSDRIAAAIAAPPCTINRSNVYGDGASATKIVATISEQ